MQQNVDVLLPHEFQAKAFEVVVPRLDAIIGVNLMMGSIPK
jgi:hypothetical protein